MDCVRARETFCHFKRKLDNVCYKYINISFSNFRAEASIGGKLRHLPQQFFLSVFFFLKRKLKSSKIPGGELTVDIAKTLPGVFFNLRFTARKICNRFNFRCLSLKILRTLIYYYLSRPQFFTCQVVSVC